MSDAKKGLLNFLQCGSCTFIERDKTFEKKCSELGKLPSARGCASHMSDAFSLVSIEEDKGALENLSEVIAHYGVVELNALASLLIKEKQTRRFGYHFYQKVFVRIQGGLKSNYFNNFVIGHVLDATKDTVRIVGFDGKATVCVYAINEANSSTYYTIQRFAPIRQAMLDSKSFFDPSSTSGTYSAARLASLGSERASVALDALPASSKRLKRAPKDDLVSLVSKMNRGIVRRSRKDVDSNAEIKII